jgi:hypothetical protein
MRRCWEVRNCSFHGTDHAQSGCPAYGQQVSCWEYDWGAFYRAMPDGPGKGEWKRVMLERCPSCRVRAKHRREVDAFLSELREH